MAKLGHHHDPARAESVRDPQAQERPEVEYAWVP